MINGNVAQAHRHLAVNGFPFRRLIARVHPGSTRITQQSARFPLHLPLRPDARQDISLQRRYDTASLVNGGSREPAKQTRRNRAFGENGVGCGSGILLQLIEDLLGYRRILTAGDDSNGAAVFVRCLNVDIE